MLLAPPADGHRVGTLTGHEGMVKGVAWDPRGKYLATQGDRELIVWRAEDWALLSSNREVLRDARESSCHNMCVRFGRAGRGGAGARREGGSGRRDRSLLRCARLRPQPLAG